MSSLRSQELHGHGLPIGQLPSRDRVALHPLPSQRAMLEVLQNRRYSSALCFLFLPPAGFCLWAALRREMEQYGHLRDLGRTVGELSHIKGSFQCFFTEKQALFVCSPMRIFAMEPGVEVHRVATSARLAIGGTTGARAMDLGASPPRLESPIGPGNQSSLSDSFPFLLNRCLGPRTRSSASHPSGRRDKKLNPVAFGNTSQRPQKFSKQGDVGPGGSKCFRVGRPGRMLTSSPTASLAK